MTTIEFILALLGSNGFIAFITLLYSNKKTKKDNTSQMILALGRKELLKSCKEYKSLGYIPYDEYSTFDELGKAYISLGGNSKVKKLYEEVQKLELREE